MLFKFKVSNLRVSSKLLLMNLMICAAFFLIVCIIVFSFISVRNKFTEVADRGMERVITNSRTAREFSKLFADIDLLGRMFYGNNEYLASEGNRLAGTVKRISENTTDPDLKESLLALSDHLDAFIAQCAVVNSVLHDRESIDRKTHAEVTRLENLIVELLVRSTLEEQDTSFVEQLLTLVIGYRESLLQIGKLYAEMEREHYIKPLKGRTSPLITAIDDLILRLQTITASDPQVAQFGKKIERNVRNYKKVALRLYAVMEELGYRLMDLKHSKSSSMLAMEKIDKKASRGTLLVRKEIEKIIYFSGAAVLILSILVIVLLGFATTYLIKSTINSPMQAILKGLESFRTDNFDTKIELRRGDEWDIIEKSFNNMAADLSESYMALQESQRNLQVLFDSLQDFLFILDMKGHILQINPVVLKRLGYTKAELLGEKVLKVHPPDQHAEAVAMISDLVAGKNEFFSIPLRTKDGTLIPVDTKVTNGKWGDQDALFGISRDITERKIAEEEKAKLQSKLQQIQKMESIGTLAGGIAHNFNNLLMGIQGRISLILMDTGTPQAHLEHLNEIEGYIASAADLTRQFLGFARGGKYSLEPTNLNDLIKTENHVFAQTRKAINIQEKFEQDLWTVECDKIQIKQVLSNIYVNAWQAMPDGGDLNIRTENVILDNDHNNPHPVNPGKYVKITITDFGVGMDAVTQQRIFDPFFTTKKMARGTGLGLASAYGIIKNHYGFIDVSSKINEGTIFYIYLPASQKAVVTNEASHKELLRGKETLLFVDDEDMIIDVGCRIIEKLGYKALAAKSGKEAIEVYQKNQSKIDMVILDMIMPEMGGGETYDRLKKINPNIKVLLSSGYSINGQATEILEKGCDDFIQKPFSIQKLSIQIREILDRK